MANVHALYQDTFRMQFRSTLRGARIFAVGFHLAAIVVLGLLVFLPTAFASGTFTTTTASGIVYLVLTVILLLLLARLPDNRARLGAWGVRVLDIPSWAIFVIWLCLSIILGLQEPSRELVRGANILILASLLVVALIAVLFLVLMHSDFLEGEILIVAGRVNGAVNTFIQSTASRPTTINRRATFEALESIASIQLSHKQMFGAFLAALLTVCLIFAEQHLTDATNSANDALMLLATLMVLFLLCYLTLSALTDSLIARALVVLKLELAIEQSGVGELPAEAQPQSNTDAVGATPTRSEAPSAESV